VHWTCESTRWIMRHENSSDIFEEADWYGNRSVSVLPRNRKFPDGRNSLRVPDRARFRASAWFTWLSRNLAAALPWQRPQRPGIPTVHEIRFFLCSRAFLVRRENGYLSFTLTLSISACLCFFPTIPFFSCFLVLPEQHYHCFSNLRELTVCLFLISYHSFSLLSI